MASFRLRASNKVFQPTRLVRRRVLRLERAASVVLAERPHLHRGLGGCIPSCTCGRMAETKPLSGGARIGAYMLEATGVKGALMLQRPTLIVVTIFAIAFFIATPRAHANATCFCKITYSDLNGIQTANSVLLDLTNAIGHSYGGISPQSENNQSNCKGRCYDAAAQYIGQPSVAAAACAAGAPNGVPIRAWSAVGTRTYRLARGIGVLINTPAVTNQSCWCPSGSLANSTNQQGPTTDGKCKKHVGTINASPLPPNGTPIGSWGFTWINGIWQWVAPSANCSTVIVSPAACRFQ